MANCRATLTARQRGAYGYGFGRYGYGDPCLRWNGWGWVNICY
jgi:hypothetical protein